MAASLNEKLETPANASEPELAQITRTTILSYLRNCGVTCEPAKLDLQFYNDCCEEAIRRGYPMDTHSRPSVRPFIPGGVAIATTAYRHLRDHKMQILIALFTACAIYLDDISNRDIGSVYLFNERFWQGKPQGESEYFYIAEMKDKIRIDHRYLGRNSAPK